MVILDPLEHITRRRLLCGMAIMTGLPTPGGEQAQIPGKGHGLSYYIARPSRHVRPGISNEDAAESWNLVKRVDDVSGT
jgi:hypothetical protein